MNWRYHNPVEVHFGAGALDGLKKSLGARRAVLVTFSEAAGLGLTARVEKLLGDARMVREALGGVRGKNFIGAAAA